VRFAAEKLEPVDVNLVDFNGIQYHIYSPDDDNLNILKVAMKMKWFNELVRYGAMDLLQKEFADLICTPDDGWDFTLKIDTAACPDRDDLLEKVSNLKRTAMAAPFHLAFKEHDLLSKDKTYTVNSGVMVINYRDEESIYIRNQHDRVTVIFTTKFGEETDRIMGKVFLQEFVDARRQTSLQNSPQVIHSKEPPLEIQHLDLRNADKADFITFILFPRHFTSGPVRETTISQIQLFRDYLHYHIKCCKAYMHSRMRKRVAEFLKVLNRAKPEASATAEKKLASGRSFRRQEKIA